VKRSIAINEDRQKDFANEIRIQSKISHRNLVQLLGCCLETDIPMLVYEFVPRGSLYDVLHVKTDPLPLLTRLNIAIYSAVAFAYMHLDASDKILHGDVKSGNILLDEDFTPKVSDFGTSRLMSMDKDHTNWVVGDSSYIDPVYMKTGLLTEKSDVYSFGIVLLELVTRKKARYDGNHSLPIDYVKASMHGTAREMFDKEIVAGGDENVKCLEEVGRIALRCLEDEVDDRPTMSEVTEKLKLCKIVVAKPGELIRSILN
jgi:serine/threonine protein kinase